MATVKGRLLRLGVHIRRHPLFFAAVGFASGLASFLLVERQEEMAALIALFMLASWAWLLLEHPIRRLLHTLFRLDLPPPLLRFTTQIVHQESFFFILPFLFITTSWESPQLLFSVLIALAALISIVDPLYNGWLARRRWMYLAYHSLALFALLLAALPVIFQLDTLQTYLIATGLAVAFAFPSLCRVIPVGGLAWAAGLTGLTVALAGGAWLGRVMVPPATLWLTSVVITEDVDRDQRSAGNGVDRIPADLLQNGGIYAYTAVRAPRGLRETIYHHWIHDGQTYDVIPLEITGGREAGYRAWTRKENFPQRPEGQWEVRVKTRSGQMIGRTRFQVESEPGA
ncbi:DUF5924 family protein [Natronospira bacteriovora]|uniref:DUF5924 family protein n=1 Tax=Natronospira bacteriovora TaxID=3069753 RepID=A0ABU0W5D4_9GAMM|nr:DUF5924 family protein [Natronospira sp. AB-CW4]MDQ2069230.1 DUF5924 family protein [Natronospira sp. AB-CW4]